MAGRRRPQALDLSGGIFRAALALIERKLGITPAGIAVLTVAGMAFLLGKITGRTTTFVLVYALVGLVIFANVAGRRAPAIEAGRSSLPGRARVGQVLTVDLQISARRRIGTIVLEEVLPAALGSSVRLPLPVLSPGNIVEHSYQMDLRQRGICTVGPLVAIWSDPFGLTRRRVVLAEAADIIVHPSTESVIDRINSRQWEDPPVRPLVSKPWPTGFEFYGMRDYVSGDDPRRIVWRATARLGKYVVREAEQGITDRVNIFLDNDREHYGVEQISPRFETAVRTAASAGARHLRDGFSVGLQANHEVLAKGLRGPGARAKLMDPLALINTEDAPLTLALDRLLVDPHRGAHNIVITPHVSVAAATRLRILIERGIYILVVMVLDDDTPSSALHRVGALGANVVEVRPGGSIERAFGNVIRTAAR